MSKKLATNPKRTSCELVLGRLLKQCIAYFVTYHVPTTFTRSTEISGGFNFDASVVILPDGSSNDSGLLMPALDMTASIAPNLS